MKALRNTIILGKPPHSNDLLSPFIKPFTELHEKLKGSAFKLFNHVQKTFEWAGQTLPEKIIEVMRAKNHTANYHVYDAILPEQFSDKAAYCQYVQDLYLEWQRRYFD